jgi:hypothetical protein
MTLTSKQMELRRHDQPWHDGQITKVSKTKTGWDIQTKAAGFFLQRDQLNGKDPPRVGDEIATYTHRGSMIRGVDLRGEPLFYKTDAQLAAEQKEWSKNYHAEQKHRFEKERKKLDRQFAALPDVFQRRISWFRAHNPDFRWQNEAYEMAACVDAVLIADTLKTAAAVRRFQKMRYQTQLKKVPGISREHSANSFGIAVRLAWLYLHKPLFVIAEHGALTPLVGCEKYGCVHPRPADVMAALDELSQEDADAYFGPCKL